MKHVLLPLFLFMLLPLAQGRPVIVELDPTDKKRPPKRVGYEVGIKEEGKVLRLELKLNPRFSNALQMANVFYSKRGRGQESPEVTVKGPEHAKVITFTMNREDTKDAWLRLKSGAIRVEDEGLDNWLGYSISVAKLVESAGKGVKGKL